MWVIQKSAVPDEQQKSVQELQISFRSDQIEYLMFINKSKRFSQSISIVLTGGDIILQKPNITWVAIH